MATIRDSKQHRLEELSVSASRAFVDSGLHGIEAEVVIVIDHSARMAPLYESGVVQGVASALLALSMKFDDDGVVPIWTFADDARHLGEIRRQDHSSWVARNIPVPTLPAASTEVPAAARYGPFIDAIGRRYFPKDWGSKGINKQVGDKLKRTITVYPPLPVPRVNPLMVIVVTCGDCADALETTRLLRRASYLPIFWQFAGIGTGKAPGAEAGSEFRFLHGINKLADTHVDNCGFFEPGDLSNAEELYRGLLNELPNWLGTNEVQAMLQQVAPPPPKDDGVEALIMSLPPVEAAKRERARLERERRRSERANMAELEVQQASAWPTIRTTAESENGEEVDPVVRGRNDPVSRRMQIGTRPYKPGDGVVPSLPPRRPTVSFAAFVEPPSEEPEEHDENTVETAVERLARIRARRNARKGDEG